MLSLGCPGSFERYVSLKSKYLTIAPFTNVAMSGVVFFLVPRIVDARRPDSPSRPGGAPP